VFRGWSGRPPKYHQNSPRTPPKHSRTPPPNPQVSSPGAHIGAGPPGDPHQKVEVINHSSEINDCHGGESWGCLGLSWSCLGAVCAAVWGAVCGVVMGTIWGREKSSRIPVGGTRGVLRRSPLGESPGGVPRESLLTRGILPLRSRLGEFSGVAPWGSPLG
jgi:hypothetical protein